MGRKPFLVRAVDRINNNKSVLRSYANNFIGHEADVFKKKTNFGPEDFFSFPLLSAYMVATFNINFAGRHRSEEEKRSQSTVINIIRLWEKTARAYYRVGTAFGEELFNSRINISPKTLSLFSEQDTIFFEFHKPIPVIGGRTGYAAMVKIAPASPDNPDKLMYIALMCMNDRGNLSIVVITPSVGDSEIKPVFSPEGESAISQEGLSYILKCFLYVHSGDPDLRELKPDSMSRSERRKAEKTYDTELSCPQTLVSWHWKKPIIYKVGETYVVSFPRWQPYGKGRALIKLIWVREHVRHYGRNNKTDVIEEASELPDEVE